MPFNPIDPALHQHFDALIDKYGFSSTKEQFFAVAQNCIYLAGETPDEYQRIGNCRLGGVPDVPKGFEWPDQMSFIAQLNLQEVARYDVNKILPDRGMLYFFLGDDEEANDVPFRVLWAGVATTELVQALPPQGYNSINSDEYEGGDVNVIYDPFELSLKQSISLPCFADHYRDALFENEPDIETENLYNALCDELEPQKANKAMGLHQLLGHDSACNPSADVLACYKALDMDPDFFWIDLAKADELIAELENRDPNDSHYNRLLETRREQRNYIEKVGNDKIIDLRKHVYEWALLLELDSDLNAGMCFRDAGTIHIMTRKEDLAKRDFNRVSASLSSL